MDQGVQADHGIKALGLEGNRSRVGTNKARVWHQLLRSGDLNVADVDSRDMVAIAGEISSNRYSAAATEIQDVARRPELLAQFECPRDVVLGRVGIATVEQRHLVVRLPNTLRQPGLHVRDVSDNTNEIGWCSPLGGDTASCGDHSIALSGMDQLSRGRRGGLVKRNTF
jgi:hypothetical protein